MEMEENQMKDPKDASFIWKSGLGEVDPDLVSHVKVVKSQQSIDSRESEKACKEHES